MNEVWKDVTFLNNIFKGRYQISNLGRVRSLSFTYVIKRQGEKDRIITNTSIPIVQLDLNFNLIKEWKSGRFCCRSINATQSRLNDCCNHKSKSHKGFIFMFKTEWECLQPKIQKK